MPTYEYECIECNYRFEKFQSMSDEPVKVCEKCGKEVRKLFGSAGIIFKGSGFYVNDYKNTGGSANSDAPACKGSADNPACEGCKSAS